MKQLHRIALVSVLSLSVVIAGCVGQAELANLVTVLGDYTSQLATLEKNPILGAKLKTDTAAASAAILAWKKGNPTTEIIEVLNIVQDDLALFPGTGPYAPLIALSIGTVEAILSQFPANANAQVRVHDRVWVNDSGTPVHLKNPPKTKREFWKQWNALAPADAKH